LLPHCPVFKISAQVFFNWAPGPNLQNGQSDKALEHKTCPWKLMGKFATNHFLISASGANLRMPANQLQPVTDSLA